METEISNDGETFGSLFDEGVCEIYQDNTTPGIFRLCYPKQPYSVEVEIDTTKEKTSYTVVWEDDEERFDDIGYACAKIEEILSV